MVFASVWLSATLTVPQCPDRTRCGAAILWHFRFSREPPCRSRFVQNGSCIRAVHRRPAPLNSWIVHLGEVRSCGIFVFRECCRAAHHLCNLVFAFAVPNAAPAPLHCVHHPLPGSRRRVRHFPSRRSPFRQSIVEKQHTSSSRDHASTGQGEESGSHASATSGSHARRTHGCGCTDALCVGYAGARGEVRLFLLLCIHNLPPGTRPARQLCPIGR